MFWVTLKRLPNTNRFGSLSPGMGVRQMQLDSRYDIAEACAVQLCGLFAVVILPKLLDDVATAFFATTLD